MTTTNDLDYENEKENEVVLNLQAVDSGQPALSITEAVTVKINDINESPTMASLQEYEINGKNIYYHNNNCNNNNIYLSSFPSLSLSLSLNIYILYVRTTTIVFKCVCIYKIIKCFNCRK